MIRLDSIAGLSAIPGPVVLAAGVFDGVHRGHQAVLRTASESALTGGATPVALTFDPHPASILRPESAPRLLTSTAHKLRLIAGLGYGHVLVIAFDAEFAAQPPATFLDALCRAADPLREIVVGCGWAFGKNRTGSIALMREFGAAHGFGAIEIPSLAVHELPVSSTRIREAITRGDLDLAKALLGRPYEVFGTVVCGERIGRSIGFRTANLATDNELFPPDGVYAATVTAEDMARMAVVNIGRRPTVASDGPRLLEAHLPGFEGDLYDRELTVSFDRFLRAERKFASLEELKEQIGRDIQAAG